MATPTKKAAPKAAGGRGKQKSKPAKKSAKK